MKKFVLVILLITTSLHLQAQPVKDADGLTGYATDLQLDTTYKVTYVQVVYDFDSVTWGVYLLNGVYDDAAKVVEYGELLKIKYGSDLYPLSDEWKYISKKQFKRYSK